MDPYFTFENGIYFQIKDIPVGSVITMHDDTTSKIKVLNKKGVSRNFIEPDTTYGILIKDIKNIYVPEDFETYNANQYFKYIGLTWYRSPEYVQIQDIPIGSIITTQDKKTFSVTSFKEKGILPFLYFNGICISDIEKIQVF